MRSFLLLFWLITLTTTSLAQRKVKLDHANTLKGYVQEGKRVDWVVGDVVFKQNQTTIYCDSAIFFRAKNSVEAFGRIKILEGDSVTVTALKLNYDGDKKIAYLRNNVVFQKLNTATLYTDFLDYDRPKNEARYFQNGKLVDSTNTLTSVKGYYDLRTNTASFKNDVKVLNKDYTMSSDTLQYNSKNRFVYFRALTKLEDRQGGIAYYESGFYDTRQRQSDLSKGDFQTPNYELKGARLFLDDTRKMYKARGNVVLVSKKDNMQVHGDEGVYNKKTLISKVYGHAYAAMVTEEKDTIFISADTLVSIDNNDPSKRKLVAYHHVRIFKSDIQGKSDSLIYNAGDSTLYFYRNPILWATGNQMTADSIKVLVQNKKISRINMVSNAFVVSSDTLQNYNQIKGRRMTAYFDGKALHHVVVEGNGESVYFALQEKEDMLEGKKEKFTIVSGMNKIICSNMRINFKAGKVNNVSFYVRPDASFIPPHELKPDQMLLKGFTWHGDERPTRKEVGSDSHNLPQRIIPEK
ncbi:MAG: organic solvent tolerance protein OstA [Bacteroidetes bacterium]|nr:organic solvent tolerance protein OstA [Bacteroidota bacterium]